MTILPKVFIRCQYYFWNIQNINALLYELFLTSYQFIYGTHFIERFLKVEKTVSRYLYKNAVNIREMCTINAS